MAARAAGVPRVGGLEAGVVDVRFRPLRRDDFELLGSWMAAPHVAPWWQEDPSPESIEARYGPSVDGADPTETFVVEIGEEPVAFVQRYLFSDNPTWDSSVGITGAAGIDYLIGVVGLIGTGIGPRIIDQFTVATLARHPGVPSVVAVVQQANRRSWRALEKAGFVRVYAGPVESDDPADEGPSFVYERRR